jgi:DNA-binding response OmpR family regulator
VTDKDGNGHGGYTLGNDFWVDGSGVDFKLGFILRPFESSSFRIGAAVHTPTFFSLKERNTAYLRFDLSEDLNDITKPYDARGNDTEGEYEYKLITPWKFNASMGYTIGSSVALGVEYEYSDRTSAKMKDPDDRNTLLIVEDHETLRHYLRQTFEHLYRVIDVADGHEAIACLANEYPDIILSDVMMPGIRGDELCRMVKENPDTSGIPVVLLTAKANHEAIVEGLKKGADDYIPKPFSTEILKLKVQGLIDNRNRQRQFFMRQAIAQVEAGGKRDDNESNENNESIDNKNVTTASETMAEGDRRFIMQATRFVLEHLDEPDFNINLLCHEMAMSRTLFYSRLKSLTGKGPQEFIRIIRLQKAAELLKEGKSVTDVAAETGFVNTKYFSSLFKKQFGMQPSKYSGK